MGSQCCTGGFKVTPFLKGAAALVIASWAYMWLLKFVLLYLGDHNLSGIAGLPLHQAIYAAYIVGNPPSWWAISLTSLFVFAVVWDVSFNRVYDYLRDAHAE